MTKGTPHVWIATYDGLPGGCVSDGLLLDALHARHVKATAMPWTALKASELAAPAGLAPTNVVVIRTTWDYFERLPEFLDWLSSMEAAGITVWNSPSILRWNCDKHYLGELSDKGIAIPDSTFLPPEAVNEATVRQIMSEKGWGRAVLKPCVSGNSWGCSLLRDGEPFPADSDLVHCRGPSGAILQEYMEEIQAGELALVMIEGKFAHCVRKVPADGEFRVQERFGGYAVDASGAATPELIEFAENTLKATPEPVLYARVDVVLTKSGPKLMELEIFEPELFNQFVPGSADVLADAIIARATAL
jgi:glutathione synthase/RimK-type ligase-like ATP-grasp enzyme